MERLYSSLKIQISIELNVETALKGVNTFLMVKNNYKFYSPVSLSFLIATHLYDHEKVIFKCPI
jgi:hypothetical protein